MKIKELYSYPVKSTRGIALETAQVLRTGFKNDRIVAIIDRQNKIVTGREHPKLIQLVASIENGGLIISAGEHQKFSFALPSQKDNIEVKLFRNKVSGKVFDERAKEWISDYLQGDFRLLYLGNEFNAVLSKRGGKEGELKGFSDSSPIHLINLGTLNYLNSKLKSEVRVRNFRPNIVIENAEPFEEDKWSILKINGCLYRIQELTARCIFTTIDPKTCIKDADMQPLTTLAMLRMKMGDKATFGIGLVPLDEGVVSISNKIKVIEKKY